MSAGERNKSAGAGRAILRLFALALVFAGAAETAGAADLRYRDAEPVHAKRVRAATWSEECGHCYGSDLPWGGLRKVHLGGIPWGGLRCSCGYARERRHARRVVLVRKG